MEHKGCDLTEVTRQCQLLLPSAVVPSSYNSIITSSKHHIVVKLHHTASTQFAVKTTITFFTTQMQNSYLISIESLSLDFT
jgi:hypothetical protein